MVFKALTNNKQYLMLRGVMVVWMITRKIVRTVLCCMAYLNWPIDVGLALCVFTT